MQHDLAIKFFAFANVKVYYCDDWGYC